MDEEIIAELVRKLEKKLSKRQTLYNEDNYSLWGLEYYITDIRAKQYISGIISELEDYRYEFTRKQFDMYISAATYRKGQGYLVGSRWKYKTEAIWAMFRLFTPTNKQMKELIECYKKDIYGGKNKQWIKVLLGKGYNFTSEQIKTLIEYNCVTYKLFDNYEISKEDLEALMKTNWLKIDEKKALVMKSEVIPTKTCMMNAITIRSVNEREELIKTLIEQGCDIDEECMYKLMETQINIDIIKLILVKGNKMSNGILKKACKERNTKYVKYYITELSIKPDIECLNSILWDQNLYNLMVSAGVKPNRTTLKLMGERDYDQFIKIIEKWKIIPDKECLDYILQNADLSSDKIKHVIVKIMSYKVETDEESYAKMVSNIKLKNKDFEYYLELMIECGLDITIRQVKEALLNKRTIKDIERFGIEYDEYLYYLCHRYKTWPREYKGKIEASMEKKILGLRELCKHPKIMKEKLINYMALHNVKIDRYCLENAFRNNSYLKNFMLYELKLLPTIFILIEPHLYREYKSGKNKLNYNMADRIESEYNFDWKTMKESYDIDMTLIKEMADDNAK